ncbi:hypothetical protein [Paenirhodobacter populi]|uniref:hypothetical protein n=1 Tax=Paenirhodobacter populi TaxID=2306993 RepID=UPI00268AE090
MPPNEKRNSLRIKARVARKAVKGERTVPDLGAEYGVHPTMNHHWKKAFRRVLRERRGEK